MTPYPRVVERGVSRGRSCLGSNETRTYPHGVPGILVVQGHLNTRPPHQIGNPPPQAGDGSTRSARFDPNVKEG